MKRLFSLALVALICMSQASAQVKRSDEFHQKYHLEEVFVFSRHNIRAPLAEPGSFISTITPHTWHDFGVGRSELTMKGGVLETINGQFFHQWVVSEGLFPENAEPTADELVVIANSKQRTISTARHFISSFMPMQTVTVSHEGKIGDMDQPFSLNLEASLTEQEWQQIRQESDQIWSKEKLREVSESLIPNLKLLEDVLDTKNSQAYKDGTFTGFNNHDFKFKFEVGKEPAMEGSVNDACQAVDALILQYYEEPDMQKVAFGKQLLPKEWQALYEIIHVRDKVRFCSPYMNSLISNGQRTVIAEALQTPGRKFTFMCGHDVNILNILQFMRIKEYETTDAIEIGTPIGSKIVFEKWVDESGNAFIGVNHVYQKADQLRKNTMLNLQTPPNVIPLQFEDMTMNEDGLYTFEQIINRLTGKDKPSALDNVAAGSRKDADSTVTLSGVPATSDYRGIIVRNNETQLVK